MIDIHSHILPGLDDGAMDDETSLSMLRMSEKGRINTIIATPHYNMKFTAADCETIRNECIRVNEMSEKEGLSITIVPGQEINIGVDVIRLYNEGVVGCIGKTKYMLLELRYDGIDTCDFEKIYELRLRGIIPVIPHPERYDYIINKPSIVNELIKEGCLMQINTGSVLGVFGSKCKKVTEILIKHGAAHFIGTDCHGLGSRSPNLGECIRALKKENKAYSEILLTNNNNLLNEEKIINNASIITEKRGIFGVYRSKNI